jgi:hypothetical protein
VAGTVLLGRYRIVSALGRGGMGEVYRAEDITLQQEIAVKFLPAELTNDPAALERFHREVRIARQVSHPNVCRVFDIGVSEGAPFITMEYVDGEDLSSLVRRIGRFPQDKGLEIGRQICAGLAAAHELGLLHRDLKPANVMLDGRGRVRVTDFGLASLAGDVHGADVRSGTPAYMAPEQIAGAEVTFKSDIYALGLVLYEIFTGKRAYDAPTLGELSKLRESSAPASPTTLVKELDPLIERVIQRCLEKDPARRPASALQVAAALPGGNPLAAALAAGELPSPEMVAAAGSKEGLKPLFVWTCIGIIAVCVGFAFAFTGRTRAYPSANLTKPPEVLEERAKEMLQNFGYTNPPKQTASGFDVDPAYLIYIEKNDKSQSRWNRSSAAINYWYRQTPEFFAARQILGPGAQGQVSSSDPPAEDPGMIEIDLDTQGRLQYLHVVTRTMANFETTPDPKPDWNQLLAAGGFDPAHCQPAEPARIPPNYADARASWTVPMIERPEVTLHIEAAAYRGRPVYFTEAGPWTPAPGTGSNETTAQHIQLVFAIAILGSLLVVGIVLAWNNCKLKRADLKGALKLGGFVFVTSFVTWLIGSTHVMGRWEAYNLTLELAWASLAGLFMWMLYVALEPVARRRLPTLLISWNRLLAGQFRDPMIGRDLLAGTAVGLFAFAWDHTNIFYRALRGLPPPGLDYGAIQLLIGGRTPFAQLLSTLNSAIFNGFALVLTLVILQLLLRNKWLSGGAFALIFVLKAASSGQSPFDVCVIEVIDVTVLVFFIWRFGLLALAIGIFVQNLINVPITTDTSAWYAWMGWLGVAIIVAMVAYGARIGLAGQPLFGRALAADD